MQFLALHVDRRARIFYLLQKRMVMWAAAGLASSHGEGRSDGR